MGFSHWLKRISSPLDFIKVVSILVSSHHHHRLVSFLCLLISHHVAGKGNLSAVKDGLDSFGLDLCHGEGVLESLLSGRVDVDDVVVALVELALMRPPPEVGSCIGGNQGLDVTLKHVILFEAIHRRRDKESVQSHSFKTGGGKHKQKASREKNKTKQKNSRLLHGVELSVRVHAHLDTGNYSQQAERGRGGQPVVVAGVALDDADVAVAVDDVQLLGRRADHGVLAQGRAVRAHGDAAAKRDVPVHEGVVDRSTPVVQVLCIFMDAIYSVVNLSTSKLWKDVFFLLTHEQE